MDDWFAKDPIVGKAPAQGQTEWWSADPIAKQERTLGGAAREAVTNLPGGIAKTAMGVLDIVAGVPRTVAKAVLPEKLFSAIDTSVGDASAGERASEAARTALYDLPVGLAVKAGKSAMGIPAMRSEGELDRPIAVANAFIDSYKAYGNEQEFLEKLATQPESILGDLSLGLGLGAKAAPIGQIADALKKASVITDPLMGPVAAATRGGTAVMNAADLLRPERTIANKLISLSKPGQVPAALRATKDIESAVPLTTAERLAEAGIRNPEIAGLERNLVDTSTRTGREAFAQQEQRVAQLQDQLARVDAQLQTQTNAMAPAQSVEVNVARDRLARTLAEEQASLAQQQAAAAAALPVASQAGVGKEIAGQARALKRELQTTEIEPAKQAAIQAAGSSRVDLSNVFERAEDILGQPLTTLKPDTAPEITRILQRFAPTERPGDFIPLGYGGGYTGPPKPPGSPMATLNDIDALGKALSMDISAAKSSTTGAASQRLGKLYELHGALDEAIAGSALPQAAKDQWAKYRGLNRERYVPEFKTGEVARMFKSTSENLPKLRYDQTTTAFLKDETSAQQFVTTFGKSPEAKTAMQAGLGDLFRDAVVDPVTQTIKPDAVAKFKDTYAKQIDILDKAGMNIKSSLEKTYAEARQIERGMDNVKAAAKKFGEFETGAALIDSTLKSPKDMGALRRLVGPDGREAISQHLTSRALELLKGGDAPGAIKYLTDNEAAIKANLTKPKVFTELLENAQLQKNLADVKATAPETSAKLVARLEPSELRSLAVIARDIQRMKEVDALAAQSSAARGAAPGRGGKLVSETAGEMNLPPIDPTYMSRAYTTARAIVRKLATKLNTRTTAVLTDRMLTNPNKLIADIEAQMARQERRAQIRAISPPLGLSSAVNALAPANQNAMRPE